MASRLCDAQLQGLPASVAYERDRVVRSQINVHV